MTGEIFTESLNSYLTSTDIMGIYYGLGFMALLLIVAIVVVIIDSKKKHSDGRVTFKDAFKYPFNRATGMRNILWVLIPIVGWFALCGYTVRIVQEFVNGKFKQLPKFKFGSNLKLGFMIFIKAIPFWALYIVIISLLDGLDLKFNISNGAIVNIISIFLSFFIIPIITINFLKKETVKSYFEFKLVKHVFNNIGDYIVVMLKSLLLGAIFIIMSIILIGIPASTFTKNMFLADFYRRKVK